MHTHTLKPILIHTRGKFDLKILLFNQQVFFDQKWHRCLPKDNDDVQEASLLKQNIYFSACVYIWAKGVMSRIIHTFLNNK